MEAITAFVEGPACFVVVYGMLMQSPWVYTLQILVSSGQMYGDILYFATSVLEGKMLSSSQASKHIDSVLDNDIISPDVGYTL